MFRRLSREASIELAKEALKFIARWIIPPGVGVLGWLQHVPWFYVVVGVILSGAGIMTWLLQWDEWRNRNRVEHKLKFQITRTHITQVDGKVAAIKFGFQVQNLATFPIKFRVEELRTKLTAQENNRSFYPPNREYENNVIKTSPGGIGWFFDHDIILPTDCRGNTTAELQCELLYGKADRFDHALEAKKKAFFHISDAGVSGEQRWYDQ